MKLIIHRGAKQIGGSCVELATDRTRLIIDAGLPLDNLQDPAKLRVKLRSGQPETRTYTAIYVLNDEEVGLVSDAVAVLCKP